MTGGSGITVAICSYNAAGMLTGLVQSLQQQDCQVPLEILVVDNNSTDDTHAIVSNLPVREGVSLRYVLEKNQGIPYARNRAIEESLNNDYLAFIDADETPEPGWLAAALDALSGEAADCVGGKIRVQLPTREVPAWITPQLLAFLGELDHGDKALWVEDRSTPVWSGNVAYRTGVFSSGLRFDTRYNRSGKGVGGGSDGIMFRKLLEQEVRIRYRPDMIINHRVESEKIRRSYFVRLHYVAGKKCGEFQMSTYKRSLFGVSPFMVRQLLSHAWKTLSMWIRKDPDVVRQAMNASYAAGTLTGRIRCWKSSRGAGL